MDRVKVGKGYYRCGYGKGYNKSPNIYLIRGKYYAKHKAAWNTAFRPLQGDLVGYVEVKPISDSFYQV